MSKKNEKVEKDEKPVAKKPAKVVEKSAPKKAEKVEKTSTPKAEKPVAKAAAKKQVEPCPAHGKGFSETEKDCLDCGEIYPEYAQECRKLTAIAKKTDTKLQKAEQRATVKKEKAEKKAAEKKEKAERAPRGGTGAHALLRKIFTENPKGAYTVAELSEMTGKRPQLLYAAMGDLKSEKYARSAGVFKIERGEDKKYRHTK